MMSTDTTIEECEAFAQKLRNMDFEDLHNYLLRTRDTPRELRGKTGIYSAFSIDSRFWLLNLSIMFNWTEGVALFLELHGPRVLDDKFRILRSHYLGTFDLGNAEARQIAEMLMRGADSADIAYIWKSSAVFSLCFNDKKAMECVERLRVCGLLKSEFVTKSLSYCLNQSPNSLTVFEYIDIANLCKEHASGFLKQYHSALRGDFPNMRRAAILAPFCIWQKSSCMIELLDRASGFGYHDIFARWFEAKVTGWSHERVRKMLLLHKAVVHHWAKLLRLLLTRAQLDLWRLSRLGKSLLELACKEISENEGLLYRSWHPEFNMDAFGVLAEFGAPADTLLPTVLTAGFGRRTTFDKIGTVNLCLLEVSGFYCYGNAFPWNDDDVIFEQERLNCIFALSRNVRDRTSQRTFYEKILEGLPGVRVSPTLTQAEIVEDACRSLARADRAHAELFGSYVEKRREARAMQMWRAFWRERCMQLAIAFRMMRVPDHVLYKVAFLMAPPLIRRVTRMRYLMNQVFLVTRRYKNFG
jgi:hypothetical protein